jgi:hypothetical protein
MNAIHLSALPARVQAEILAARGISPAARTRSRVTAWKDIPASWGICKLHSMAWFPSQALCVMCDDTVLPLEPEEVE